MRLLDSELVPLFCYHNHYFGDEQLIIIDLPQAEVGFTQLVQCIIIFKGFEQKVVEEQQNRATQLSNNVPDALNNDKENLPEGCTLDGDPLKVTFLSIEKLDKMAAINKSLFDYGFENSMLDRFNKLDLHLIPGLEAQSLIFKLVYLSKVCEHVILRKSINYLF